MVYFIFSVAILAIVLYVRRERRGVKRNGGGAGVVALAFGLAFSTLLDPAKKASIEELDKRRELGRHDAGENGELDEPV